MIKSTWLAMLFLFLPWCMQAQTVTSFEGISAASDVKPGHDVDPNGAIGTKQYMEWTNVAFQAYDKVTFNPVWSSPLTGETPWNNNANTPDCAGTAIHGDGLVLFDHLASRWIVAGHSNPRKGSNNYYFCIAVSNTDDLTSSTLTWYAYEFSLNSILGLNSQGVSYFPDWPKLGTWWDGYYLSFDILDPSNNYAINGVGFCALDRTNILTNSTANPMQCFKDGLYHPYLKHSPIPADIEGTTPPPSGRDEFFVSIQNPARDGKSIAANAVNLWDFHVDWTNPANSTFTNSSVTVPSYTPGCYTLAKPTNTVCAPQPGINQGGKHYLLDTVADRLMPRLAYRNFGSHESFLISHTVRTGKGSSHQTAVGWYEFRANGSNLPVLHQSGVFSPDTTVYRFMPSIAQDKAGNVAMGYSVTNTKMHAGIRAVTWKLGSNQKKVEQTIQAGGGDQENSADWGDYTSMTVDPVDDCTFWYVNEYLPSNETGKAVTWHTKIANFKVSGCGSEAIHIPNPPLRLLVRSK